MGGCVRDWLLRRPTKDLDLVVEGEASPLVALCRRRWGGKSASFGTFGTHRVFLRGGMRLDIARARRETYPEPAALPRVVPATLEEDLWRRDFSINALALILPDKKLLDPTGGREDLGRGRLRMLHAESFRDDPTRIFRAARFASRFRFAVERRTARALRACILEGLPARLSRERLRQELRRILEEREPGGALNLLRRWRVLDFLQPRLRWQPSSFRDPDPSVRLGCLAAAQGPGAAPFLADLRLDRDLTQAIQQALDCLREERSPRSPLSELSRRILRSLRPRQSPQAFRPLLADGEDLRRLGLPPGKRYAELLGALARAQWSGRIRSRREALRWMEREARKSP